MTEMRTKPHYHVVAAVVVACGRCLCVRKGTTRYAYTTGRWEFPGGKIERGETARQALARELMEEMSLHVSVGEHLTTVTHHYPDFSITLEAYACTPLDADFALTEHTESRWVEPERLMELEWCAADVEIAREAQKRLESDCQIKK